MKTKALNTLPYQAPDLQVLGLLAAQIICNSPNHPGTDIPWLPDDDDEL